MQLIDAQKSQTDNVYKLIFQNHQQTVFEVSYLRKNDGKDILVLPTQTSCNMGCSFCFLTGMNIKAINLSNDQIVELVNDSLKFSPPSNDTLLISFMGAGEPLLNVDALICSAQKISTSVQGYKNIRFAISTLIPGEKPFRDFMQQVIGTNLNFKLHWSLHSVRSPVRKSLMPGALFFERSAELVKEYLNTTNRAVEVHYTLIENVNDSQDDAEGIARLIDSRMPVKLLKFAPHKSEPDLHGSTHISQFKQRLESLGILVEIYAPPGNDVNASCGMFIADQYSK